jgi:hypothetical protein
MLATVLFVMRAQIVSIFVHGMITECVEFVVAHYNLCGAGANHCFNNFDDLTDLGTAIDQVVDEDRAAIRSAIDAALLFVAQPAQQRSQLVRVAMESPITSIVGIAVS